MTCTLSLVCTVKCSGFSATGEVGGKGNTYLAVLVNSCLFTFVDICHLPLVASVWNVHHTAAVRGRGGKKELKKKKRNPGVYSEMHTWNQRAPSYKYAKHNRPRIWSMVLTWEGNKCRSAWELRLAVCSLKQCQTRTATKGVLAVGSESWDSNLHCGTNH